jgi:GNAT superfamily N-acetyltransferase
VAVTEYGRITLAQFRVACPALLQEHYEELTLNKEVSTLAPDWAAYEKLEKTNRLFFMAAFDGGDMIGYTVFIVGSHMHYRGLCCAHNDVLFLQKDYRKGFTGVRLIRETEKALAALGVRKLYWHIKAGTTLEKLLPRLGYEHEEQVVAKILGD